MMEISKLLSEDLFNSIRIPFERGDYKTAIVDGFLHLSEALRTKADLEGDGADLVNKALGGNDPKIKLNKLESLSDRDYQKGMHKVALGMYEAFRNPRAHERMTDTVSDALVILMLINYVLKAISEGTSPFSTEDFDTAIRDKNFPASNEYATLLVSRIPPKFRLECMYKLLAELGNISLQARLRTPYRLFKELKPYEQKDVKDHISRILQTSNEQKEISAMISCFPPEYWTSYDMLARLRVEAMLLDAMQMGWIGDNGINKEVRFGAVASGVSEHFTPKNVERFTRLLGSDFSTKRGRRYALSYFKADIPRVLSPEGYKAMIVEELNSDDRDMFHFINDSDSWRPFFEEELEQFKNRVPDWELPF